MESFKGRQSDQTEIICEIDGRISLPPLPLPLRVAKVKQAVFTWGYYVFINLLHVDLDRSLDQILEVSGKYLSHILRQQSTDSPYQCHHKQVHKVAF